MDRDPQAGGVAADLLAPVPDHGPGLGDGRLGCRSPPSRILNGRETGVPIREETRQQVISVAAELGYKPNLLARGLRGGRSSLIGIIARDISDPFHIQSLRGINDAARAREYRLFLGPRRLPARGDDRLRLDARALARRRHHRHGRHRGRRPRARHPGRPAPLRGRGHRPDDPPPDPGMSADSAAGTHLAMDHLWALGHRAIICVSDSRTYDGRLRIDRYERYMRDHGAAGEICVFVTDQEPEPALEPRRASSGS